MQQDGKRCTISKLQNDGPSKPLSTYLHAELGEGRGADARGHVPHRLPVQRHRVGNDRGARILHSSGRGYAAGAALLRRISATRDAVGVGISEFAGEHRASGGGHQRLLLVCVLQQRDPLSARDKLDTLPLQTQHTQSHLFGRQKAPFPIT